MASRSSKAPRRGRGRPREQGGPDPSGKCLICNEGEMHRDNSTKVLKAGKETLVTASNKYGDGLHDAFKTSEELWLHTACRKRYTHPYYQVPGVSQQRVLRSLSQDFSALTDCLLCGKAVADDRSLQQLSLERRKKHAWHAVETVQYENHLKSEINRRGDNKWGQEVELRLASVLVDLTAAEARYHQSCSVKFFKGCTSLEDNTLTPGRPSGTRDQQKDAAFAALCDFLVKNDECQFSLTELQKFVNERGTEEYSRRWLKRRLTEHFGDSISITGGEGGNDVVNFSGFTRKLLFSKWHEERKNSDIEERQRVVKLAAEIILEDLRKHVNKIEEYPSTDEMLRSPLPNSLQYFLDILITTKSQSNQGVERKRNAIGQALMFACRPKSYIPPFLLALSADLHAHLGSRWLTDVLHSVSFGVSYPEVRRYMYNLSECTGQQEQQEGERPCYDQFVFDNADWNTDTLSGHNSWHCMGGIRISTPARTTPSAPVPRRPLPSAAEQGLTRKGKFGIPIEWYVKPRVNGMDNITVKPMESSLLSGRLPVIVGKAQAADCLWAAGRWVGVERAPSWNGYMKAAMSISGTLSMGAVSGVEALPFIDMDPGNLTTINSALLYARRQAARRGQGHVFVTFDQPLFTKAMQIVASDQTGDLDGVKVRLGGFHLLMSYLGAIAKIMEGSGLEDLWAQVYAPNSVQHMMSGKAYSRSLRAHFLAQEAVGGILMASQRLNDGAKEEICRLHQDFLDGNISYAEVVEQDVVQDVWNSLQQAGECEARRSRTGALFWLYYRCVGLVRLFIRSERVGDWDLNLECQKAMLPIFHATAHLHYAKATHLHVQQMEELSGCSKEAAEQGRLFARQVLMLWACVPSDMVIEQFLMRSIKVQGGLTRRGLTDSVILRWVLSAPALIKVSAVVETVCGLQRESSEQHKELRDSRQSRDQHDLLKMTTWLQQHSPFTPTDGIRCISTGRVGKDVVNCDKAEEIGKALLEATYGKTFGSLSLPRKGRVVSLAHDTPKEKQSKASVEEVNSNVLFMRMCWLGVNDDKLKDYMKYELASMPPALFLKGLMRRNVKSNLTKCFDCQPQVEDILDSSDVNALLDLDISASESTRTSPAQERVRVVDGGYLLHVMPWESEEATPLTYRNVCSEYVKYVLKHYGRNSVVVFDGYGVHWSTKCEEQRRRASCRRPCPDFNLEDDMKVLVQREDFLANINNKSGLIRLLAGGLREAGVRVTQANADADVLIAQEALDMDEATRQVDVIATDTDIVAILIARARDDTNISVIHPHPVSKDKVNMDKVFGVRSIRQGMGDMVECVLLAHAMSGCDTCSATWRKGKLKVWDSLKKNLALRQVASTFNLPNATREEIARSGEEIMLSIYAKPRGTPCTSLDALRFVEYKQKIPRTRSTAALPSLADFPPTSDAARQHSFRVYLQVQQWLGNPLTPTEWGWRAASDTLEPVPTLLPPAPPELMRLVACECKAGCKQSSACRCRKAGLQCTTACLPCEGLTCSNTLDIEEEEWLEADSAL